MALANRNAAVGGVADGADAVDGLRREPGGHRGEWKYAGSSTKSSGTLKGNTPGKIWVRVAANGADDQPGASSDPAEDLVRDWELIAGRVDSGES